MPPVFVSTPRTRTLLKARATLSTSGRLWLVNTFQMSLKFPTIKCSAIVSMATEHLSYYSGQTTDERRRPWYFANWQNTATCYVQRSGMASQYLAALVTRDVPYLHLHLSKGSTRDTKKITRRQRTHLVTFWRVRVTIFAIERQQCVPCVLLSYISLST